MSVTSAGSWRGRGHAACVALVVLLLSCAGSVNPIINYTPVLWNHVPKARADARKIAVYTVPADVGIGSISPERIAEYRDMYKWPDRPLEIIGTGYVPLKVGEYQSCLGPQTQVCNFSAEQAVQALREEAIRRGADAIFVWHSQEEKQIPAVGGLSSYGGYYRGGGTVLAEFMNAAFVVYK